MERAGGNGTLFSRDLRLLPPSSLCLSPFSLFFRRTSIIILYSVRYSVLKSAKCERHLQNPLSGLCVTFRRKGVDYNEGGAGKVFLWYSRKHVWSSLSHHGWEGVTNFLAVFSISLFLEIFVTVVQKMFCVKHLFSLAGLAQPSQLRYS